MPDAQVQQARALDAIARELPKMTRVLTVLNENIVAIGKDFRKVVDEYVEEDLVDPGQLALTDKDTNGD